MYTNPFQTVFQIDNTEPTDIHVELFDVLGKSLEKQIVITGSKALLGNKEGSGLYILSVEGEKE